MKAGSPPFKRRLRSVCGRSRSSSAASSVEMSFSIPRVSFPVLVGAVDRSRRTRSGVSSQGVFLGQVFLSHARRGRFSFRLLNRGPDRSLLLRVAGVTKEHERIEGSPETFPVRLRFLAGLALVIGARLLEMSLDRVLADTTFTLEERPEAGSRLLPALRHLHHLKAKDLLGVAAVP